MGIASYFEGIQDARGEPEKEQPYRTAREWLEKVRPHLDEFEKSLSEEELLNRVIHTLRCLSRQGCADFKFSRDHSRRMWQVFVRGSRGSSTKIEFTPDEKAKASVIEFTPDERAKAYEFAKQSVPDMSNSDEDNVRIGKLGQVAFAKFLRIKSKKSLDSEDIFTGRKNFQTSDGKTIDTKAPSRDFYTRILVSCEHYEQEPKDYYVGVRVFEGERKAKVVGFAEWQELKWSDLVLGTYEIEFHSLRPIIELIDMMDNA